MRRLFSRVSQRLEIEMDRRPTTNDKKRTSRLDRMTMLLSSGTYYPGVNPMLNSYFQALAVRDSVREQ